MKLTGDCAFLEPFRIESITTLSLKNFSVHVKKYAARLLSADAYLTHIEDGDRRTLTRLCKLAGVGQVGQKYLKGAFALVLMHEQSSMKEIAGKWKNTKGTVKDKGPDIRKQMDKKAKEKFPLMENGRAKTFITNYLSACLDPERKQGSEESDDLL